VGGEKRKIEAEQLRKGLEKVGARRRYDKKREE